MPWHALLSALLLALSCHCLVALAQEQAAPHLQPQPQPQLEPKPKPTAVEAPGSREPSSPILLPLEPLPPSVSLPPSSWLSRLWSWLHLSPSASSSPSDLCSAIGQDAEWVPRFDAVRLPDSVLLALELPGVERESLLVSVTPREVAVRGTRSWRRDLIARASHDRSAASALSVQAPLVRATRVYALQAEMSEGRFERRFALSPAVNDELIAADFEDGVLFIHLPIDGDLKRACSADLLGKRIVPVRYVRA